MNFKKISILSTVFALFFMMAGCNEDDDNEALNYVALEMSKEIEVVVDETATGDVKVYASAVMDYDRTYNIVVNTSATTMGTAYYNVPATVTIPANSNVGSFKVNVTGTNLGIGKLIVLNLASSAGAYVGKPLSIEVSPYCDGTKVVIDLNFDGYASETTWELIDESSNLVASGGGYANGLKKFQTKVCLTSGHYYFIVYDQYGDGMYDGTTLGNYKVSKKSNGDILVSGTGDFPDQVVEEFDID